MFRTASANHKSHSVSQNAAETSRTSTDTQRVRCGVFTLKARIESTLNCVFTGSRPRCCKNDRNYANLTNKHSTDFTTTTKSIKSKYLADRIQKNGNVTVRVHLARTPFDSDSSASFVVVAKLIVKPSACMEGGILFERAWYLNIEHLHPVICVNIRFVFANFSMSLWIHKQKKVKALKDDLTVRYNRVTPLLTHSLTY